MADVGDVAAIREKLASNRERSQRSGSVDVNDGFSVLRIWISVVVLNTGHEVERRVANRSAVPLKQMKTCYNIKKLLFKVKVLDFINLFWFLKVH